MEVKSIPIYMTKEDHKRMSKIMKWTRKDTLTVAPYALMSAFQFVYAFIAKDAMIAAFAMFTLASLFGVVEHIKSEKLSESVFDIICDRLYNTLEALKKESKEVKEKKTKKKKEEQ